MTGKQDRAEELKRRAEAHASQGRLAEATACFEELLALRPDDASVLLQLSYIDSMAGGYRKARDFAMRAYALGSRDPEVNKELAPRLRTFNAAAELHGLVQRLRPIESIPIPLLLVLAAQFSYFNVQDTALDLLDEARRGDPRYPPMLLARAQVLIYLGKFNQAEADLLKVSSRAPQIAQTYWLLAQLGRPPERRHAEAIFRELQRPGRKPGDIAVLAYALHQELDRLGDVPRAWRALQMACAAKRSLLSYAPPETVALVDGLTQLPGAETPPAVHHAERTPIFIVGMHRSGTTLLEQLLDGNSDVRGIGELYDFTTAMRHATDHHCRGVVDGVVVERSKEIDFAQVGRRYLDGVAWRLGSERFFTDKLPSNFLNLGFICRALPEAKVVHMVRDPVETCFSNLRELFSDANPYSYDQLELAGFFKQYRRLMAHWHQAFPGRILDVDYARLTRDPETVLREVSDFCGLDFQQQMLDMGKRTRGVATASAVQVRSKVEARERPKWVPYEEYLQPLIKALRE